VLSRPEELPPWSEEGGLGSHSLVGGDPCLGGDSFFGSRASRMGELWVEESKALGKAVASAARQRRKWRVFERCISSWDGGWGESYSSDVSEWRYGG